MPYTDWTSVSLQLHLQMLFPLLPVLRTKLLLWQAKQSHPRASKLSVPCAWSALPPLSAGDRMFASPRIHRLKLNPTVMVFGGGGPGSWLGHEGGAPMIGISVLVRRDSREIIFLSTLWGYRKKATVWNQEESSTSTCPCWPLISRLPDSRSVWEIKVVKLDIYVTFVTAAPANKDIQSLVNRHLCRAAWDEGT